MKKNRLMTVFVFLFLFWPAGAGSAVETINIAGTGDSIDILRMISFEFTKLNPDIKILLPDSVGSGGGIKSVSEGTADLGRIARAVKEEEKKYGLDCVCFAQSPVVFVVNFSGKKIDDISCQGIVDIYSGKITFWNEMGGSSKKIYVANREDGDSSRMILEKNIPGFKDINPLAGKVLYNTQENAEILQKYKDTIGYVPLSIAMDRGFNILKVNGVYPSAENVKNKSYNLVTPFSIVWKGELAGKNKKFVNFLFSQAAKDIMMKHGTIPMDR